MLGKRWIILFKLECLKRKRAGKCHKLAKYCNIKTTRMLKSETFVTLHSFSYFAQRRPTYCRGCRWAYVWNAGGWKPTVEHGNSQSSVFNAADVSGARQDSFERE